MEQEIHRMKLKMAHLSKCQEKLVGEMEKSVYRYGEIGDRTSRSNRQRNPTSFTNNHMALQKQISDLTNKVKAVIADVKECDRDILQMMSVQSNLSDQTTASSTTCTDLDTAALTQAAVLQVMGERRLHLGNEVILFQGRLRRYTDIKQGSYKLSATPESRSEAEDKVKVRASKIVDVLKSIHAHPYATSLKSALVSLDAMVSTISN